jgi:hypothetical protein
MGPTPPFDYLPQRYRNTPYDELPTPLRRQVDLATPQTVEAEPLPKWVAPPVEQSKAKKK